MSTVGARHAHAPLTVEGSSTVVARERPGETVRSTFPDVAKILAIVAVVIVHVAAVPNEGFGQLTTPTWLTTTIIETAMRWCVPVFVMVSGMLLLRPRATPLSTVGFYRRRATRIAIPLVIWTVAYRFFQEQTGPHADFLQNVQAIWSGQPYYHLYFLFIIAGLYVVCPFLTTVVATLDDRQLRNLALGALAFGFLWGGVWPWLPGTGSNAFTMFVPYIGYFVAGAWLARVTLTRPLLWLCAGTTVAIIALSSFVTYEWVAAKGLQEGRYLYGYLAPSAIVMSLCVFLLLRALCAGMEARGWLRPTPFLHTLSAATFGVYLMHPIFLTLWLRRPPGAPTVGHELAWWLPLTVGGLLLLSLVCALVIRRIPLLRRVI